MRAWDLDKDPLQELCALSASEPSLQAQKHLLAPSFSVCRLLIGLALLCLLVLLFQARLQLAIFILTHLCA